MEGGLMSRVPAALRSPVVGLAAAGTGLVAASAVFGGGVMALATGGALALGSTLVFARNRGGWSVLLARTRFDFRREVGDPATNSIVGSVVGWIARNFPEAPVRIVPEGSIGDDDLQIKPGPTGAGYMLRLLEKPNAFYSGILQWHGDDRRLRRREQRVLVQAASGERPGDRAVVDPVTAARAALARRRPDAVFISHYEYRVNGRLYAIDPLDIVHFRNGIDPDNQRKGRNQLTSLLREIFTDDEAANFTAALLRNLGVPGVVISPSNTTGSIGAQTVDPEVVKTTWMEKTTGDKRGEPFVSNIPIDVKSFAFNPQQMQLRELRRIPEERVSAVLGVPAGVAGLGAGLDRNTFSNYGEANKAAYTQGVIPLHRLIAAELELQLLPDFVNVETTALDVWFDWRLAVAMQEAAGEIWKRFESAATKGLVTRAAFKRATGQKASGEDEVYILPNNYLVAPAGSSPAGAAPRRAPADALQQPLLEAGPLLCAGTFRGKPCGKLLAEQATAPYRIACSRCKTVAESGEVSLVA
jgi:hypothetical protein